MYVCMYVSMYISQGTAAVPSAVEPVDHMNDKAEILRGQHSVLVSEIRFLFPVWFCCCSVRQCAPLNVTFIL